MQGRRRRRDRQQGFRLPAGRLPVEPAAESGSRRPPPEGGGYLPVRAIRVALELETGEGLALDNIGVRAGIGCSHGCRRYGFAAAAETEQPAFGVGPTDR
jgi:hypothetical protein